MTGDLLAIDWGTTNRRAYRLSPDGRVLDQVADDRGVLSLTAEDFPTELARLRDRLGRLPAIAAGMVGSTRGWREVPYRPAPADLPALAAGMVHLPEHDLAIVPGVSIAAGGRADVMRGEEVQVLGAVAAGLVPADALCCQPGTHAKWVRVAAGRIVDAATAMTGELFRLLRQHGTLSGMLDGTVTDGPAFRAGLVRGRGATDLLTALFEVRAAVLLGASPPEDAAARASGLLIGADVGDRVAGQAVYLLAHGPLRDLYTAAIEDAGGQATAVESHRAFVAGIHQLRGLIR